MADEKKILIVDDDFEISLFLRTTLEIIWPDYQVVNVPSGEEAMLEVRRGVDVIIADMKLPGIHGLEFVEQVRRVVPNMPIIVITGEESYDLHEQIRKLDPTDFFLKPFEVDDVTNAVRRALGERAMPEAEELDVDRPGAPQIARCLSSLRVDTGAHYVMLVDLSGRCLAADGQVRGLDTARIASLLVKELLNSLELARALKAPQPFTINYQAGALHDLYAANVGANYIVALIFDSQRGRSQIGAVWVYARRAIKELLELLSSAPAPPPTPKAEPEPAKPVEKPDAPPPAEPVEQPDAPPPAEPESEFSSDEVDAFWDSVLGEDNLEDDSGFSGISLEEARSQGLIPTEFDLG